MGTDERIPRASDRRGVIVAYDEQLAERIRDVIGDQPGISERKMFGGIAFMLNGNMACGIVKDELMVRVGSANHEEALARPHARPMDFTNRPMKGMVFVGKPGFASDDDLRSWIDLGLGYAGSLPPKT
jgi:TfoX/Sxy family transcriptional regulator of competence genes